jgi:endonuclease YncB( thermonuclease family)
MGAGRQRPGARVKTFAFLLFALCAAAPAWSWTGRVQEAPTGDSLLVRAADGGLVLVRLYGIEAPAPAEPEGRAAQQALDGLARDRQVDVLPLSGQGSRQTGHVYLDLQDLSREMVRLGRAWVDWPRCVQGVCRLWLDDEQQARAVGLGLWQDSPLRPDPEPQPGG